MMTQISVKITQRCAFCKYWYDPCNMHIEPRAGAPNIWKYESTAKCKCLKRNLTVPAFSACKYYVCKVDIV